MKDSKWNWVAHPDHKGERLKQVGILVDGTLHNPNGYPEDIVRRGVEAAEARRTASRKEAAALAAATRKRRYDKHVHAIAQRVMRNEKTGPSGTCIVCKKALADDESIQRGIGSDCWQRLLSAIEERAA